jgi:chitinase
MKFIFYYQTFSNSIKPVLYSDTPLTHIHLSSIHFGKNWNGSLYIHLNNLSPYDASFDNVWNEMAMASNKGIKVMLMIGGAGGGYAALFSDFSKYYSLLHELIQNKSFIAGVDLDVEEPVEMSNIQKLIYHLKHDFGASFLVSMAPVQSSLQSNGPGMGGFSYKDLLNTDEGKMIDYYNGQFYSDYSETAFSQVIKNGYSPNKIVMGQVAGENIDVKELKKITNKYGDSFGGVFFWEYFQAPPYPNAWLTSMKSILCQPTTEKQSSSYCSIL